MPWYAIAFSIMATQASAITFISTTGQSYVDGMRFVQFYFGLPIAMIILSVTLVPNWQCEVPTREAKEIIAALEHQVISVGPESSLDCLDGVIYALLIVGDFNSVQFKRSNESPAEWQPTPSGGAGSVAIFGGVAETTEVKAICLPIRSPGNSGRSILAFPSSAAAMVRSGY